MTFTLYDAVVPSNLQILGAVDSFLDKAAAFCSEQGRTEADIDAHDESHAAPSQAISGLMVLQLD